MSTAPTFPIGDPPPVIFAERGQILAQLSEGVIVADADGAIVFVNEAAERLHGVKMLGVAPDAYSQTYHLLTESGAPYPPLELPLARAVLTGVTVKDARWRIRRPDGSEILAIGSAQPLFDPAGQQVGAVLTLRDDTARHEAEDRLRESETRLRALTNNLPMGLVYQATSARDGSNRRFTYISDNVRELSGVDPDAVIADPTLPYRTIDPAFSAVLAEAEAQAIATLEPLDVVVRYRHVSGAMRWCRLVSAPRLQADTSLIWDGIQVDVTDQKAAEEVLREANHTLEDRVATAIAERETVEAALRQAQKMEAVGRLTGGIAHDFNNMLAIVVGSLDLLKRQLRVDDLRAIRYAEAAAEGAHRAAQLTQRLLAFSRQQALDPRPVELTALIHGMVELLERAAGATVRLETELTDGARLHVDPHQLESALLNLVVNARDAMPDGGRVTISTAFEDETVLLAVRDSGLGMSAEVIAKAFDPFFTTKPVGKGTGLGLSQVYGFAQQSNGTVRITSVEGNGTTVSLRLPRYLAEIEDDSASVVAPTVSAVRADALVLVVEDDPAVREVSVKALAELGYTTLDAGGATAAIDLLRQRGDIAMLLTDVVMPDVDGVALASQVRRLRPGLPIVFMTGFTGDAIEADGALKGETVLRKPFTIDALGIAMNKAIEGRLSRPH